MKIRAGEQSPALFPENRHMAIARGGCAGEVSDADANATPERHFVFLPVHARDLPAWSRCIDSKSLGDHLTVDHGQSQ